jgi:hypothetical protein
MDKRTFWTCRNKLAQLGLISFKEGKGAEMATYKIHLVGVQNVPTNVPTNVPSINTNTNTKTEEINISSAKNKIDLISLKKEFEKFKNAYNGTKRGLDTEFDNFKKKNSNYQEIIPLLMPALEKLNAWREEKRKQGGFVPEIPHLQTWINQRRWEAELEVINDKNKKENEETITRIRTNA